MFSLYTMSKPFFKKKKRQAVLSTKEAARPIGRSNTRTHALDGQIVTFCNQFLQERIGGA